MTCFLHSAPTINLKQNGNISSPSRGKYKLLAIEEPQSSVRSIHRSDHSHILLAASKLMKTQRIRGEAPLSVNTLHNRHFLQNANSPRKGLTISEIWSIYSKQGWNSEKGKQHLIYILTEQTSLTRHTRLYLNSFWTLRGFWWKHAVL